MLSCILVEYSPLPHASRNYYKGSLGNYRVYRVNAMQNAIPAISPLQRLKRESDFERRVPNNANAKFSDTENSVLNEQNIVRRSDLL